MDATNLLGYEITEQLYTGTRTLVYRAIRTKDKYPVVIKLLRNEYPNFNELIGFRNQYTIAKNLDFPSIIKPLNLEIYRNSYALVMEDFGGVSLFTYLKAETEENQLSCSLSLIEFLNLAIQLSDILDYLYQNRVIHKDIKPANILINPETKQIKLIDFSISSLLPRETQKIQNANALEGTLAYLSPEQTGRMNRGIDYRSDFYSLGVTFYELLTGQLPFVSDDPMELVHCHLAKQPISVHIIQPKIPLILSQIVSKLMAKNAEIRYQNALGMKHDLEICLAQLQETGTIASFELGKRDITDRFLIAEKLYGRETEVNNLLQAFDRVSTGATEMMLVAGFSGIGKTAVVNEVHKPIVRQRGYFIKGKYDQFQRNIPFSAFVQAFRDLMGQLLSESDRQLSDWKAKILEAVSGNGQVLIDVIPELELIIDAQPAATELSGTAAQNRFNLLIQKFVKVFTNQAHPLVMFIDDLQWADSASLNLLKLLMQDTQYLLVLGAYRDNEVSPAHPFMLAVDEIGKSGVIVKTITLKPLSLLDMNRLVADTLVCELSLAQPLTELIYQKTKGNPFFATQFLKALYENGQITFDWKVQCWQCDIAQLKALTLTDDVVEFMALQLQKLPAETQNILKLAACIGTQFDLNTLAIVSEKSSQATADDLWKALQEGLIIPNTEIYKFFLQSDRTSVSDTAANPTYRFLHDRVQQAAYSLIADNYKQISHLKIGRLLLGASSKNQESDVFKIVNQFNQCIESVDSSEEILTIAKLNHISATKARETTAFLAATEYAQLGIHLLGQDAWQENYDLILALRNCLAEAAYLAGRFDLMTDSITDILSHARTLEDRLCAYEVQLQALKAQNQLAEALALGLEILNLLEISLPTEPTLFNIEQAFSEMEAALQGRAIADLIDLPQMSDRTILAAARILASLCPVAHMVQFNLLPILLVEQVQLALRYGNSPAHTHAYAGLGIILCAFRGDIERGYEAGQLALALLERIEAESFRSASTFVTTYFTLPWKTAIQSTFNLMLGAYTSGVNTGDLEHAGYAVERYGQLAFFSGAVELSHLETQMDGFAEFMRKQHQYTALQIHNITHQVVLNWQGKSIDPSIIAGAVYDEISLPPQNLKQNNSMALISYYINKLILAYSFVNDSGVAVDYAMQTIPYLEIAIGSILMPVFYTYDSLARLHHYGNVSPEKQQQYLIDIDANQEKIKNWATYAPMNYLHKYNLVEAERHRVLSRNYEAADFYDRAISEAKENQFLNEEALANELAAKFYLECGKEKIAQAYMTEAYYCYGKWGAKAKIVYLENRYTQLLQPILQQPKTSFDFLETLANITHSATQVTSTSISNFLDFASVIKAAQALSSAIELEELLRQLTQIILQNSGGDKCILVLPQDKIWQIKAISTLETTELCSEPLDDYPNVPIKLIQYVKRTQSVVVLDNLETDLPVIDDYLTQHQPKSVLCLPILDRGHLAGILYLKNQSTAGVFTSSRITTIEFLCTQVAISLENARLYQQAQAYAQQLQQSQLQIVQSEKMSALGNLVAGVAHEINNPVGFVSGNLHETQQTVQDLVEHLNLYRSRASETEIADHAEDIDLDYIIEDLFKMIDSMKVGCDRIKGISTSLRTFSRADTDRPVACNIHDGIDSTIMILKHRLKANESRPEIAVIKNYGDLPLVECFAGQLNQVFMNLLANAIDALDESNIGRSFAEIQANPNRITIRTTLEGEQVKIAIADNGPGIPEAVKTRIFDHLFTTKGVGKGTGLGLTIARQIIVEKHGGAIEVNSEIGKGTELVVMLPICAGDNRN